jgi:uncharacterized protein involved in tolerance to divalent cations
MEIEKRRIIEDPFNCTRYYTIRVYYWWRGKIIYSNFHYDVKEENVKDIIKAERELEKQITKCI